MVSKRCNKNKYGKIIRCVNLYTSLFIISFFDIFFSFFPPFFEGDHNLQRVDIATQGVGHFGRWSKLLFSFAQVNLESAHNFETDYIFINFLTPRWFFSCHSLAILFCLFILWIFMLHSKKWHLDSKVSLPFSVEHSPFYDFFLTIGHLWYLSSINLFLILPINPITQSICSNYNVTTY